MPNRVLLEFRELIAAFVLSAEASGRCEKIAGDSIRSPCSLHMGRPCSSQITPIISAIRSHHESVPGLGHCPLDPKATRSYVSARAFVHVIHRHREGIGNLVTVDPSVHHSVVVILGPVDNIGHKMPVESWMAFPQRYPFSNPIKV